MRSDVKINSASDDVYKFVVVDRALYDAASCCHCETAPVPTNFIQFAEPRPIAIVYSATVYSLNIALYLLIYTHDFQLLSRSSADVKVHDVICTTADAEFVQFFVSYSAVFYHSLRCFFH